MTFRKIKILLGAAAVAAFGFACDDMLQVEPEQSVSPEVATSSATGIRAVYNRAYRVQMTSAYYGQRLMIAGDALADNAVGHPSTSGRYTGEPVNSFGSGVGGWGRYSGINDINTVIKYTPELEDMDDAEKSRILGEMHFLRALAYHDLAKVYSYEPNQIVDGWDRGVIIRTTPTETVEDAEPRTRSSVQATYEQIEEDLLTSIDYFSSSDGSAPEYANKAASHALLARVYLYWERWDDAIEQATLAIDESGVSVAPASAVAGMFAQSPNPEAIFELDYTQSESVGINEALSAILTPSSHYDLLPSDEFLATLADEDVRNGLYVLDTDNYPNLSSDRAGFRYVTKYDEYVGPNTDDVPLIRVSEVYLTRAEAHAEVGNEAEALDDLNEIRTNRGLDALTDSDDLVMEILDERRRELAFEGHRWHDLKRRGMDIVKPAATGVPTLIYGENVQFLAQIPTGQVSLNPNLEQNPGY